jgi:hypothetical protein
VGPGDLPIQGSFDPYNPHRIDPDSTSVTGRPGQGISRFETTTGLLITLLHCTS